MVKCTVKTDNGHRGDAREVTYQFNRFTKDKDGKIHMGAEVAKITVTGDKDTYEVGKDYDINGK